MKKLTELNKDFTHLRDKERYPNVSPNLYIYSSLFPDCGLPTNLVFPISWGVPLTFTKFIEEHGFTKIWENLEITTKVLKPYMRSVVYTKDNGYMLSIGFSWVNDSVTDKRTKKFLKTIKSIKDENYTVKNPCKLSNNYLYIDSIELYAPAPYKYDKTELSDFVSDMMGFISKYDVKIDEIPIESKIHMLIKDDYDMEFKDFDISRFTPELKHGDIFYGDGFDEFHNQLVKKLNTERKGIVLFHGQPGTGKTHYIRILLRELTKIDKRVIYIPPSLVEEMTNPEVISFLTNNIIENEMDTVLLIEDAEPLLEVREEGNHRTTGISNLLNSTDGILNDILGLVVIATFNTELKNINSAILRPGRLMARKEFKSIKPENTHRAAEILKVPLENLENNKEYTVVELLNLKKENSVLLHNHTDKKKTIGFGR